MSRLSGITRRLFLDNPVAVTLIGLCPAAAVTARVIDAAWMSFGVIVVLILTRLSEAILRVIVGPAEDTQETPRSLLRPRLLGTLFLASCFTASFEIVLLAFAPDEGANLGIYVPLIAVNCILLDRVPDSHSSGRLEGVGAEMVRSLRDSCSVGAGFAVALLLLSLVREVLGAGTITVFPMGSFSGVITLGSISGAPARAFVSAGGGLLCLGYLAGAARLLRPRRASSSDQNHAKAGVA